MDWFLYDRGIRHERIKRLVSKWNATLEWNELIFISFEDLWESLGNKGEGFFSFWVSLCQEQGWGWQDKVHFEVGRKWM